MDAVIFDLDGTLWNAMEPIYIVWETALGHSSARHVPLTKALLSSWMGKSPREIAPLAFPEEPPVVQNKEMQKLYDYENELLKQTGGTLYPKLCESLERLAEQYLLCIVSNSQDGYVQAFLSWSGLDCFRDYEMAGRTGLDKGENISLVMQRCGIDRAVYVGDTQSDADAAKKAGIPFIFASYGFGDVPDAAYRISSPAELPTVVAQIL